MYYKLHKPIEIYQTGIQNKSHSDENLVIQLLRISDCLLFRYKNLFSDDDTDDEETFEKIVCRYTFQELHQKCDKNFDLKFVKGMSHFSESNFFFVYFYHVFNIISFSHILCTS